MVYQKELTPYQERYDCHWKRHTYGRRRESYDHEMADGSGKERVRRRHAKDI
jgi:hypothetical protein